MLEKFFFLKLVGEDLGFYFIILYISFERLQPQREMGSEEGVSSAQIAQGLLGEGHIMGGATSAP